MTSARRRMPLGGLGAVAALLLVVIGLAVPSTAHAATDFPPGFTGFHTYAEIGAAAKAVADAHPSIARRFSIGTSYQGRQIWAMKISDHVGTDQAEPEVLFDGGHHSDEHMGPEMVLRIMHWLVDGYGVDPRITNIVNTREIWLVFLVNPDGAEYDIWGGKFHFWRKNRQPTPGTSFIGTDLNRNYGYRWGGGGRTSDNPQAITYTGPSPFSAPETRAVRDFLASRVVGGRQQIRAAITFHEYGRLVMWPYGYTTTNVPVDMTQADHDALVAIGKHMAATNGYKPEQASDLYGTSGTTRDFEYGTYRIFSYTFELSKGDYVDDSVIAGETGRNKEAVLSLAERAWCPLAVLGTATTTARCGAFDDDFEVSRGWKRDPNRTDTSASGWFNWGDPASTSSNGPKQLGTVTSGHKGWVTGAAAGASASANDLDGSTSVLSPAIAMPAKTGQRLTFRYVFAHTAGSTTADRLVISIQDASGHRTPVVTVLGSPVDVDGTWKSASVNVDAWAGKSVRIHVLAVEGGPANLLEVELDDMRITRGS